MSTTDIKRERALELPASFDTCPKWLRDKRAASLETYNTMPLPQRGLHLWRYTDPAAFVVDDIVPDEAAFAQNHVGTNEEMARDVTDGRLDGGVIELAGRRFCYHISDRLKAQGAVIEPLSKALKSHEKTVKDHLYKLANDQNGIFEALNGALWEDGIFVYLPPGTVAENPIYLRRETGESSSKQFYRLLVVVGDGSDVSIIDEYNGGSAEISRPGYSNSAVEIFGGCDSHVRYVSLQRQAEGMTSYLMHRAAIGRGGEMITIPLVFGGALSKQNFGVRMDGPGAESSIYGLLLASGRRQFDNHTLHHHASGQTQSDIDFKVVLRDRARSAYTGLIRIEQDAGGCEAYQENRNLLLTKGARAETIPELEILNEDVSCSHGATVGPIDPEMVFYLTSRGMPPDDAVRMVVSGFVASTLKRVPDKLNERIAGYVERHMEGI